SHYYLVSFLEGSCHHRPLHSFPTRRSSDLSLRFCCTTELRSKAFSCVTATCTGCMVGGSMRGRITLTSNTTHTSTARNSGSNPRSEEHTSELQSPDHLVCRLLLEKKKKHQQ